MFSWENNGLAFIDEDLVGVALPHDDPVAIIAEVGKCFVLRLIVDEGPPLTYCILIVGSRWS